MYRIVERSWCRAAWGPSRLLASLLLFTGGLIWSLGSTAHADTAPSRCVYDTKYAEYVSLYNTGWSTPPNKGDYADFDGDGDLDCVYSSYIYYDEDVLRIYVNQSGGTGLELSLVLAQGSPCSINDEYKFPCFEGFPDPEQARHDYGVQAPRWVDVDGDGDLDIVAAAFYSTGLRCFINRTQGDNYAFDLAEESANPFANLSMGRVTGLDFLEGPNSPPRHLLVIGEDGSPRYFELQGETELAAWVELQGDANPFRAFGMMPNSAPTFGDFDHDGDKDLVVAPGLHYFENKGTDQIPLYEELFGAEYPYNYAGSFGGDFVSTGDFNADGVEDVFVSGTYIPRLSYPQTQLGYFVQRGRLLVRPYEILPGVLSYPSFDPGLSPPALGDLDADGDLDLIAAAYGRSLVSLENRGGLFSDIRPYDMESLSEEWLVGATPSLVDLDGDMDLDLVITNAAGEIDVWNNSGTPQTANFARSMDSGSIFASVPVFEGTTLAFGDLDSDDDYDMLACGPSIKAVFENTGTAQEATFVQSDKFKQTLKGISIYYRACLADMDADGDLDLTHNVVNTCNPGTCSQTLAYIENIGTVQDPTFRSRNSIYSPFYDISFSEGSPAAGDIDGDGICEVLITNYSGEFKVFGASTDCPYIQPRCSDMHLNLYDPADTVLYLGPYGSGERWSSSKYIFGCEDIGVQTITRTGAGRFGARIQCEVSMVIEDRSSPVIPQPAPIAIACGSWYVDEPPVAQDPCDGDLPVTTTGVVYSLIPGEYKLEYNAMDIVGNKASKRTRVVTVLADCAVEGEGAVELPRHTADTDRNDKLSLSELLRTIQLYNAGGYRCPPQGVLTEDNFVPGAGALPDCGRHSADYAPADARIDLTELLRLIQFYNSGGLYPCPDLGTEDGYCPVLSPE